MEKNFHLKGGKGMAVAVLGVILGVALMLFGGSLGSEKEERAAEAGSMEAYREDMEARIVGLCSAVAGAGEVRVFVSLGGGYRYVYSVDDRGECVTVGSGSSEQAVVEAVLSPEVLGVGIVCEGAGDPRVAAELVRLVSTALGIGGNRITVSVGGHIR